MHSRSMTFRFLPHQFNVSIVLPIKVTSYHFLSLVCLALVLLNLFIPMYGSTQISSTNGFVYYVIVIDHFSKYMWFYPIKQKSDVSQIFAFFKALVENQLHIKIKTLYTDNCGEYLQLWSFFQIHGISHLTTPPYTPKHNGLSKCKHCHLVKTAHCLLHQGFLPLIFWSYALQTTGYLINCMSIPGLDMKSPLEVLFHCSPNYTKVHTFGCLCFP